VLLDSLPWTPAGKVDRNALPAPEWTPQGGEEPESETETLLAKVWQEVLHIQRVSRRDDFFVLGGHSLLAVQVVSRIRRVLDVELTVMDVFSFPTLATLAERILELQLNEFDAAALLEIADSMLESRDTGRTP
jgi:acyl carrier protein